MAVEGLYKEHLAKEARVLKRRKDEAHHRRRNFNEAKHSRGCMWMKPNFGHETEYLHVIRNEWTAGNAWITPDTCHAYVLKAPKAKYERHVARKNARWEMAQYEKSLEEARLAEAEAADMFADTQAASDETQGAFDPVLDVRCKAWLAEDTAYAISTMVSLPRENAPLEEVSVLVDAAVSLLGKAVQLLRN